MRCTKRPKYARARNGAAPHTQIQLNDGRWLARADYNQYDVALRHNHCAPWPFHYTPIDALVTPTEHFCRDAPEHVWIINALWAPAAVASRVTLRQQHSGIRTNAAYALPTPQPVPIAPVYVRAGEPFEVRQTFVTQFDPAGGDVLLVLCGYLVQPKFWT